MGYVEKAAYSIFSCTEKGQVMVIFPQFLLNHIMEIEAIEIDLNNIVKYY